MAQTRKDLRGRVLRKGESQRRSDERYVYTYTDPLGRRKYVYAQDLVTLREKEAQLLKDQMDGLDIYVAGKATVNFVFDRYMSLKNNLKPTTKSNYLYMYDRFVRDTFGKRNIAEIKYSDVVQFYNYLVEKQELQINTLETVHTLLHPTFQLAVRDDIIRKNPSDGVMAELKKNLGMKTGVRHALTIPQQRAFIEYIATHPIYYHWWPIFTVFLGTGCRIGEVLGLRWEDINYKKRIICVNHNLTYYPVGEDRASENHISTPKTEAGMRTIPMLDAVKDAFEMIWEEQKEKGWTDAEIDGMTGFIFCNRYGNIMNAQSVNRAIKRITYRAMMGEYIIYYRGKIVGGIYDDRLLVKPIKSAISYMPTATYELPYDGAKEMLLVEDVDNKKFLTGLFNAMYDELSAPKIKKKK